MIFIILQEIGTIILLLRNPFNIGADYEVIILFFLSIMFKVMERRNVIL